MTTPNIIMTRVDERLIHGQGQLWVKYLGCNTVIVANDEVSTDKIQQTLMKTVVPDSIAMRFFSLQKVIDIIHKANPAQTIFIVFLGEEDKAAIKELNQSYQVTFNTKTTPSGNDGAVEVNILDYI